MNYETLALNWKINSGAAQVGLNSYEPPLPNVRAGGGHSRRDAAGEALL